LDNHFNPAIVHLLVYFTNHLLRLSNIQRRFSHRGYANVGMQRQRGGIHDNPNVHAQHTGFEDLIKDEGKAAVVGSKHAEGQLLPQRLSRKYIA
jgi:hypothetical protein